ncbi:patatin-like phospholipase family protein [Draconibacterium sp. IB214405]|uniref:patatin-like phospholipase family protein n=1 Tax=Draconibacterium sp. IB214405 TaxID=3097352 RepID=UPI002A1149A9|nr:patatin-like phospholipase family protein [Draconibacterium sp. IB214405]MDX8341485.1 patatin-like phospholipase family protein [Draconibacterium sp. IB214405]
MKNTRRTTCLKISTAIFLVFVSAVFPVYSQQINNKDKPKIGLVLSGGGAKGLAHIGVLKVLEEAGISPDIITGTSMGGIMGGLYAAGYTAEELSEINKNANWDLLLTDKVRLLSVAMDEKNETKKYLFEIPIRDKKINLPAGVIEGQHLEAYFSELLWPLTEEEDFNQLPVPFHCMSVDMISGETIEHSSGDLVQSIRASMSIPTVFSPVKMDSMLLVDGGVARNFPVQEAINMGADIIIGVYVGFQEDITANDIGSMTEILQRAIALGGIVDAKEQFPKCDVLIIPDLRDYSAADFMKGQNIEQIGEDAARAKIEEINSLVEKYNLKYTAVDPIGRPKKIKITGLETTGLQYLSENFVLSKSGIEKGDSVSYNAIEEAINFMYGTRHFGKLTYSLKKDQENDGYILVFHITETPRAMFKLAPQYDDDLGVGITTNFTLRNIIAPATRLLFSVNIAENPGMEIKLNKFVGKKQRLSDYFFMDSYSYKLPFYDAGDRLGTYKRAYFGGGYGIEYLFGLNHQLGGNAFYKYNRLTPHKDLRAIYPEADVEFMKAHDWGYQLYYKVNTTDDLYFPKRGIKFNIGFQHILSANSELNRNAIEPRSYLIDETNEAYATLTIDHNWYKTFAKRFTYNFGVDAGFSAKESGTNGLFILGGSQFGESKLNFKNMAGFNLAEIYTYNYAMVKSALNIELLSGLYFSANVNVAATAHTYEDLFDEVTSNPFTDNIFGYSFGFKYESILGPIQLMVSENNQDNESRFHFTVGFPF